MTFLTRKFFFIRVHRRVIGVDELESGVSFLKFFSGHFFTQRMTFLTKKFFFIRVHRRVIGVEELESGVSFLKFFSGPFFYTKDDFFNKKIFFYKGSPKGNRGRGTRIWC